jgi:predicted acylesterase/phospholipase RssA
VAAGVAGLAVLISGCAATLERHAVPEALVDKAQIDGMTDIRVWGDDAKLASARFVAAEGSKLAQRLKATRASGGQLSSNLLAISGGADDGAFGAGLLVGWGQAESPTAKRPQFDLVTGVSAGALIAPFAFLGAEYDRQLSEIFTRYDAENLYEINLVAGALGGSSVAKNDGLRNLIAKYVDARLLQRIAEERAKGRVLLIGTTNIDMQRPVFWDLGRIAQSGRTEAIELTRRVLLASAAIPGVFPPVRIKVTVDGKEYDELHVDGGTTREVFYSPGNFSFREVDRVVGRKVSRRLYVIRNGKLGPEYEATAESALAVGARSLTTVLKNQTIGDLIRMHAKAQAEGIGYNLASIPDTFKHPRLAPFDKAYMRALYAEGLRLGRQGYAWAKTPPGLIEEASR